jgi:hypothetical protein
LAIAREVGDRQGEGIACWNLGVMLSRLGRNRDAIPLLEVLVAFKREIDHPDAEKDAALVEQIRQGIWWTKRRRWTLLLCLLAASVILLAFWFWCR